MALQDPESLALDRLTVGLRARIISIDWVLLGDKDAQRLKHFGFDEGVSIEKLHSGPFGSDPIAVKVGRMTVAIRRCHAAAVKVALLAA